MVSTNVVVELNNVEIGVAIPLAGLLVSTKRKSPPNLFFLSRNPLGGSFGFHV